MSADQFPELIANCLKTLLLPVVIKGYGSKVLLQLALLFTEYQEIEMEPVLELTPAMNGINRFSQRDLAQSKESSIDQNSPEVDLDAIQRAVRTILRAVGEDPDRTGLLPIFFEPDFGYRRYVDWALDVPMFFVVRGGRRRRRRVKTIIWC